MIQKKSLEITDEFWNAIKDLIPKTERNPNKIYKRTPRAGLLEPRKALEAIFYVTRTGIQWKALPNDQFGAASSVHWYFMLWAQAGVFQKMWEAGLEHYDEIQGINWTWLSVDGCMTKAPLAMESVDPNPTDRGKNRSKRHLLVDGRGVPIALVITGAQRHDVSQLKQVLMSVVAERPEPTVDKPHHLWVDKGYHGEPSLETVVLRGYIDLC
jgi:putative transposase